MPNTGKTYTGPTRILLVEDNDADAELFQYAISEIDAKVIARAAMLAEAIELLETQIIDIVFLDLGLPDGAGLDLISAMARITSIPIIVLTGTDFGDIARQCVLLGAQDYLVKGQITPKVIRRSIDFAIARSTATDLEMDLWERIQIDPDLFRWLESGALDGIWYWDLEDTSQQWYSARFKSLFGYSPKGIENSGSWWADNVHPDDRRHVDRILQIHISDPTVPYDIVARYRHRHGHYIWVRCKGFTIRDENERPIRMLGALTDVTALKRTEVTLEKRNAELERTTYILSHDLRKPIRHMVGFAEAFVEDYADAAGIDEDGIDMLNEIRKAGHKLESLLDGITAFARLGEITSWEEVSLRAAWNDALDDHRPDIIERDAIVEIESVLPRVSGSRSMIYQLFGNLLGNSLKFAHPDRQPHVIVRAAQIGARIHVEVEDNGVGIPDNMRSEAFSLFRRVGPQAQSTPGMGLGLAVVARIVEAHGGKVVAVESPTGGTTIRFDLPLVGYRR